MSNPEPLSPKHEQSDRRRRSGWLALLASVSAVAIVAIAVDFNGSFRSPHFSSVPPSAIAAELTAQPVASTPPQSGFADVVARTKPAVVSVQVEVVQSASAVQGDPRSGGPQPGTPFFRFFGQPDAPAPPHGPTLVGEGAGFFVSTDGYVVTNNHVVENARRVQVTIDDGSVYPARVIGTDPKTDLALIKVDANRSFPHVKFASQLPRVGDWVVAIGNPFGLGNTVTAGIVSAIGRDIGAGPYDRFIQVDAPINRGNSGGPTFDLNGNVVGINSIIFSPSGGSVGIGFDIPADTAKAVTASLMHSGHVVRGWLGVQIQDLTPDLAASLGISQQTGALIAQTEPGSPAARAGLDAGDVVTAVNGTPIKDARALAEDIAALAPGSSVKLDLIRQAGARSMTLTLGTMPEPQQAPPA
jgi:serine protease Do